MICLMTLMFKSSLKVLKTDDVTNAQARAVTDGSGVNRLKSDT